MELPIECRFKHIECILSAYSEPIQSLFRAYSEPIQSLFSAYSLPILCLVFSAYC
jgi:hypothetical protein